MRAVFAHCIWLDDADRRRMAETGSAMSFCPTSNLFLGSGLFDLQRARELGGRVGLGFLLADMADRFHLLKYGLAIVLVFIGGKMLAVPWFHIPIQWSLSIVGGIILISVILSLMLSKKDDALTGESS